MKDFGDALLKAAKVEQEKSNGGEGKVGLVTLQIEKAFLCKKRVKDWKETGATRSSVTKREKVERFVSELYFPRKREKGGFNRLPTRRITLRRPKALHSRWPRRNKKGSVMHDASWTGSKIARKKGRGKARVVGNSLLKGLTMANIGLRRRIRTERKKGSTRSKKNLRHQETKKCSERREK